MLQRIGYETSKWLVIIIHAVYMSRPRDRLACNSIHAKQKAIRDEYRPVELHIKSARRSQKKND